MSLWTSLKDSWRRSPARRGMALGSAVGAACDLHKALIKLDGAREYRAAVLMIKARLLYSAGKLSEAEDAVLEALSVYGSTPFPAKIDALSFIGNLIEEQRGRSAALPFFRDGIALAKAAYSAEFFGAYCAIEIQSWVAAELLTSEVTHG